MTDVATLKAIAGNGTPDERVHRLALYFEATLFGPPPAPAPRVLGFRWPSAPQRRAQHGVLALAHPRGWWARCSDCNRYLASDGTCRSCDPMKETA